MHANLYTTGDIFRKCCIPMIYLESVVPLWNILKVLDPSEIFIKWLIHVKYLESAVSLWNIKKVLYPFEKFSLFLQSLKKIYLEFCWVFLKLFFLNPILKSPNNIGYMKFWKLSVEPYSIHLYCSGKTINFALLHQNVGFWS